MNNLTYSQNGDYQIPNLTAPESSQTQPLGKYGRMRKSYLKEHRAAMYNHLLLSGKLTEHLTEIDQTAIRRLEQMMLQMMATQGLTEDLKASDPMKWVGMMNNLKAQAEEMLLTELIYN
ncbi:TnpV protein [Christensenellaceae bacterium OttesenSCG-928-M15]|nr:TnpV protein [Christensenellaceae bacterium OttesenSCG-928-M15]